MYPKNYPANALKDNKGTGMQDSPFMILIAVLVLVFAAALGVYLLKNFLDVQRQTNAVDAAENIYNTADLLSAGAQGSTRTIWVKVPTGYSITMDGDVTLKEGDEIVGKSLHISGVRITGNSLPGQDNNYQLRLSNSGTEIVVSEIKE